MLKFIALSVLLANSAAFAIPSILSATAEQTIAQSAPTTRCQVQPRPNQPSPLAMRAGLDVEAKEGNVTFKYRNFPTPVSGDQPPVTIEQERTMIFYNTTLAAARQRMVSDPKYFTELRGFEDPQSFKEFNDLLVCETVGAATPQPKPQMTKTIADLPDGSYRFWNDVSTFNVTDQKLLSRESTMNFLFTKTGDRIVGYFARPSDYSMCITGTVKGNTVTGVVNPPARFPNPAGLQNSAFDPSGYLRLGTWKDRRNLGSYSSSTLDLTKFNRINLGPRRAPSICR